MIMRMNIVMIKILMTRCHPVDESTLRNFLKQSRLVQVHMRETSDLNDDEDVVGDDDDVTWRGG